MPVAEKNSESKIKSQILGRFRLLYLIMVFIALLIVGKIILLQTVQYAEWKSKEQVFDYIPVEPGRGDICDSKGRLLVTSIPIYDIRLDLSTKTLKEDTFKKHYKKLAKNLASFFNDKSQGEYEEILLKCRKNKKDRFFLFKSNLDYTQMAAISKFPIFKKKAKGGYIVIPKTKRFKVYENFASRTLGYVTENENIVGIEGAYDAILTGIKGKVLAQKISSTLWMPLDDAQGIDAQDGSDVITSIDVDIQDVAHNALISQLEKQGAKHGSVVVMEVETGDVKAIANLTLQKDGSYKEELNYAIFEKAQPGSTFKLPALMAAFEDENISLNDVYDTGDGKIKIGNAYIHDTKETGYGKLTVKEIFELSSNVGTVMITKNIYWNDAEKFVDRIMSFGFEDKLGIELAGEPKPYVRHPNDAAWTKEGVSLAAVSIGYEVEVTPMQLLAFYNAVANNGKLVRPKFVNAIRKDGEILRTYEPVVLNSSICSKETIRKAKIMLEGVVENGTATNLKNPNYKIAGKTGTARIAQGNKGYLDENKKISYQASFVGYFPADKPKYSCIVVINAPAKDEYYASLVAVPVFREISDKIYASDFEMQNPNIYSADAEWTDMPVSKDGNKADLTLACRYLKVPVKNSNTVRSIYTRTTKGDKSVSLKPMSIKKGTVPNVIGMGAKDAVYVLENSGLKVDIRGRGTVFSQSLQGGDSFKPGQNIVIELKI